MKLVCPICLREYPVKPKSSDIECPCGGHFSFSRLKWTYDRKRFKELPPVIKMKDITVEAKEGE